MKNRLNQAMLILAIVIVLSWLYVRRTSTKRIEKYEMDKSQIMQHLTSESEIAESQEREELVELFESL